METNDLTTTGATVDFITVVSVGTGGCSTVPLDNDESSFVTVLKIGGDDIVNDEQEEEEQQQEEEKDDGDDVLAEEVLVYRLPGERLGFGLKFEGGTKTTELVKRLFIQSCASESPASRVRSSWGKLMEGDEILEIDSVPVKSMTRIDCVRCLKDSNVVIKLKVKHTSENIKTTEVLPQVVSAEKKRVPPPPPPVPPRKIPRKLFRSSSAAAKLLHIENGVATTSIRINNSSGINVDALTDCSQIGQFQSLKNSGRFNNNTIINSNNNNSNIANNQRNGHEQVSRDRCISDGSIGPPDPEVYTDLFSQESACNLSESDDTGSSVSTIVDRLSLGPTTTASSQADSLPSTPTSVQRHSDLNHLNLYDDEIGYCGNENNYLFVNFTIQTDYSKDEGLIENSTKPESLQPPICFQDAPLSYGNENVRTVEYYGYKEIVQKERVFEKDTEISKPPPPPPPRTKYRTMMPSSKKTNDSCSKTDAAFNTRRLPRLVDFVPKCSTAACGADNREGVPKQIEVIKLFLENEKRALIIDSLDPHEDYNSDGDKEISEVEHENHDFKSSLATIGEDEEEINHDITYR